ncbi:DUF350 domain-containing protein [Bacillus altitudinis]|uniref:DUF350 domain-containing protein n=1 Tax=Bacillus altitudinis TaxID=293387 RepID=UPI003B51BD38
MVCVVLFVRIFEVVRWYKKWEEIERGKLVVAMGSGGKIFGIGNVFEDWMGEEKWVVEMVGWGV